MQRRRIRILSAVTAGGLALAVAAIAASSAAGGQHTTLTVQSAAQEHAALDTQTGTFSPVNLDDCPVLHTGYPTGGCVAQLQTDLNIIQGNHLQVDGTFGSSASQTYAAVVAFQQAEGLTPDGMVGAETKNALKTALAGGPAAGPAGPPSTPSTGTPPPPPVVSPPPAGSAPAASGGSPVTVNCSIGTCSAYLSRSATKAANEKVQVGAAGYAALALAVCAPLDVVLPVGIACDAVATVQGGLIAQELSDAATQHGAQGACLKVTWTKPQFGIPPVITWWSTNNGQFCKD